MTICMVMISYLMPLCTFFILMVFCNTPDWYFVTHRKTSGHAWCPTLFMFCNVVVFYYTLKLNKKHKLKKKVGGNRIVYSQLGHGNNDSSRSWVCWSWERHWPVHAWDYFSEVCIWQNSSHVNVEEKREITDQELHNGQKCRELSYLQATVCLHRQKSKRPFVTWQKLVE